MITAVDTSVILDILVADPAHLENSLTLFKQARQEGSVIVCAPVWAELRPCFSKNEELARVLDDMSLTYDEMNVEIATLAGSSWKKYRENKGPRERIMTDFLIGAHAQLKSERFLTRDQGFYRTYFSHLKLMK